MRLCVLEDLGDAGGARAVHRPRSTPHTGSSSSCHCGAAFESATKSELPSEGAAARVPASSSRAVAVDGGLPPLRHALANRAHHRCSDQQTTAALRLLTEKTNESDRYSARSKPHERDPTAARDPGVDAI